MPFAIIVIGLVAGFLFYSVNMANYKKAGAGQTYRIESSTDVRLTRRLDNQTGTRSRVDHGFYSGSVSAAGRSEAYRMPDSIKHTIEMAREKEQSSRPSGNPHQSARPRPPFGPMNRPGAPGRK